MKPTVISTMIQIEPHPVTGLFVFFLTVSALRTELLSQVLLWFYYKTSKKPEFQRMMLVFNEVWRRNSYVRGCLSNAKLLLLLIGDLPSESVPQMITITFDDAVNNNNIELYNEIFNGKRKNPNGCQIKATFFLSHKYANYSAVQVLDCCYYCSSF